jgi:glycosyltransferase involved in cell wall biosynthesis
MSKIVFTASTLPASDTDPVPAFVKDEAIWIKKTYPNLHIDVLAPHNTYSRTKPYQKHKYYNEYRFHYFWPYSLEKLAGRGILPALKQNKLLYFEIPFLFAFSFFALWHYVRQRKPDLIYAHWFTPQAIAAAMVSKITKVPFVFDTQSSDVIVLKKVPFSKKIVASVCNMALSYTAPTQMTVDKLLQFTTPENRDEILSKLHMISYGTSVAPTNRNLMKRVEKKYGLEGKRIIYFIGRLVERKGVDILIKAFGDMAASDSSLRLIVVGDGPDMEKLKVLANDYATEETVIFTGYITGKERFALLALADVGVVPSVNVGDQAEGLPVVFMEGINYGKAMVITDATGAHEVAIDGQNAFIAKAGSVADLQKKMSEAIRMQASENKQFYEAVNELAKEFQWQKIAKRRAEALRLNG